MPPSSVRIHASPVYDLITAMDALVRVHRYPFHRDLLNFMAAGCTPELLIEIESLVKNQGASVFCSFIPELSDRSGRPTIPEFLHALYAISVPRFLRTLLTLNATEPTAPVGDADMVLLVGHPEAALNFLDRYTSTDDQEDAYRRLVMEAVLDPAGTITHLVGILERFYAVGFARVEREIISRQEEGARNLASLLAQEGAAVLSELAGLGDPLRAGFSTVVLAPVALGGWNTQTYIHETETPLDVSLVWDALLGRGEAWTYEPYIVFVGLEWIQGRRGAAPSSLGTAEAWTPEAAAACFELLADPSRMAIVRLLRDRPYYVQELAEQLRLSPATVHHHLVTFTKAGLVELKRVQHRVYYFLQTERLRDRLRFGGSFL